MKLSPALLCAALAALLCGCNALHPQESPLPNVYSLAAHAKPSAVAPVTPPPASGLTLVVSPPHAAAGYDSPRMMYLRQAGKLEYFAHNEWVDTPARMLAPMIVEAVGRSGGYRAVVQLPSNAVGDLRLDTEILRLQQEFLEQPSQVRFALRAYLVETASRRVIATRDFEAAVAAATENPRGGVDAAAQAVRQVLERLAAFCAEAAASKPPAVPGKPGRGG